MIKKVAGSVTTKLLITNIVKDFHLRKPLTKHVDYSVIVGKNSTLLTDENDDTPRNVSIVYLKGIQAAIGNKTGDILIKRKPLLMSVNKAVQKIYGFLEEIQPKKLSEASVIDTDSYISHNEGSLKLTPDFSKISETLELNGVKIKRNITGSNNAWSYECFEEYKTL